MVDWISLRLTVTVMRSEGCIDKVKEKMCGWQSEEREVRQQERKTEIGADNKE